MNESETLANLNELGESEYRALKAAYCRIGELKTAVSDMHNRYATTGTPPEFDQVEAVYLQIETLYDELERFLLPLCAESACGPATCMLER